MDSQEVTGQQTNFHYYGMEKTSIFTQMKTKRRYWDQFSLLSTKYELAKLFTFYTNEFYHLLEDVSVDEVRKVWFQHDRTPAHCSHDVRHYLNIISYEL